MKKKFSLDYSIYSDEERVKAIENIFKDLNTVPSNSDLELMANYILYGKDAEDKNAVQRKETYEEKKRYSSYRKAADKVESLDAILENPLADQLAFRPADEKYVYKKAKPKIYRPKYDKDGTIIDPGDSDIPGMVELWDSIDRLQHIIDVADGKIAPNPDELIITDSYRLYKMRHQLIEIRRDQYYLKDLFKPTIKFLNCQSPSQQTIDWNSDSFYWISREEWRHRVNHSLIKISKNPKDYEWNGDLVKWYVRRHTFNWENPSHIKHLINHYSAIWQMAWDDPYSDARILIMDFDRYQDMADLPPLRTHILTRKIDGWSYSKIAKELDDNWGIKYNENHICTVVTTEIPQRMAKIIKKHKLLMDTPKSECKLCGSCRQFLPLDPLFFGRNISKKDGFSSTCKDCEKQRRIERGEQEDGDRRFKEADLS